MNLNNLSKIQSDLSALSCFDVLIFGSYVEGGFSPKSDIDIAILTHTKDPQKNWELYEKILGQFPLPYEIHLFETLPIRIQYSIWTNYHVLFGDPLEISEYLYQFRKIWKDCKHRILENQFNSSKEQWLLLNRNI